MSKHNSISAREAADRLAILELVEGYAHCDYRREAKGQKAIFTVHTHLVVYMNDKVPTPSQEILSREALAQVCDDLKKYAATQHLVGQSGSLTLMRDGATGEAYTLANRPTINGVMRSLLIAAIRYGDPFAKIEGTRLFGERRLYVDWIGERPLS